MKPIVAFSMGDPAGIGPEIAAAAVADLRVRRACDPVLVGCRRPLRRGGWRPGSAPLAEIGIGRSWRPGRPNAEGGLASFGAFKTALDLTTRGLASALVTAPISKLHWNAAGVPYPDHTEYLADVFRPFRPAMLLTTGDLRAVLATRHIPFGDVPRRLTRAAIVQAAKAAADGLRQLGFRSPRIALCALNPHAGEGGLLGREEPRVLRPALRALRSSGLRMEGPVPADTAWSLHARGRYDALVALYHDQALIPLKLTAPYGVVNWTVGLPIVRTAPGHGTAFDIAGRGKADPEAMIQAALLAARLARRSS